METTLTGDEEPFAFVVHKKCKCGYPASFQWKEGKIYKAMCFRCHVTTEHDKPLKQRSSNGNN
jgi:hypothetical protein